jgi:hypothetical protein
MIGYNTPILTATVPIVQQDFDIVQEMPDTTLYGQVKHNSLDDYDHSSYDGENADLVLGLDRWGDRRIGGRS